MNRKLLFPVVVLVVSSIACSTFTSSTPENNVNVESTPTKETTIPQAEVVEAPTPVSAIDLTSITSAEDLPPLTFDEVLDARVESGEWTEGEGLLYIMKIFTGELSLQDDSELQSVYDIDATGIILRLQEFISNPGNDSLIKTELETMLNNLFPSKEMLDAISTPSADSNTLKVASPKTINNQQVVLCEDLRKVGIDKLIQGKVVCFEHIDLSENLKTRIYYPNVFVDDDELMNMLLLTKTAVEKSMLFFSDLELSPPASTAVQIQFPGSGLQQGMGLFNNDNTCSITLFPELASYYDTTEKYQQYLASVIFMCYAQANIKKPGLDDMWWFFGSAEYFSNLVFPGANKEHANNIFFDTLSMELPIQELEKENFVFFQYLGNQSNPKTIIKNLKEIANGKSLSEFVSDQMFNSFVVDYLSTGIPDSDGRTIIKAIVPIEQYDSSYRANINETEDIYFEGLLFVASRFVIEYEKEKRFVQSAVENWESIGSGSYTAVEADLYQNKAAWSAPPEEVRSYCDKSKYYLYVVTTTSSPQFNPIVKVTKVEEASCDPCLLGVWKVDNEAFTDAMMTFFEESGVDFTQSLPGTGEIYMNITGDYFLGFKEGGEIGTWRNNFTISVGVPNVTTFDTVIQSAGLGNYSADGKFLTITDLNDKVISSKVYMGDSELPDSGSSDASDFYLFRPSYSADVSDEEQTISGGKREYKCENNRLEIFHETEPDFVFTRADELIPTPIPTETTP